MAAAESEHLLDEVARAARGGERLLQIARELGIGGRRIALGGEHHVTHDARQQVVEIVGDAASEVADRLHLLRLA